MFLFAFLRIVIVIVVRSHYLHRSHRHGQLCPFFPLTKSWSLPPRKPRRHYDCYCDGLFQYLAGIEEAPFRKKRGSLNTSQIFDYGDMNADSEVSLTEKSNEFKITFGLYEPYGAWHKSSGFKFECFSDNFQPTDYPTQLCGNPPPPPPHHHHHYHHHHRDISLALSLIHI